jgi:hypothetical protein
METEKHVKTANLNNALGWFYGAGALLVFAVHRFSPQAIPLRHQFTALTLLPVLCLFHFAVGHAARRFKSWARVASVIMGVLLLFGFPIGTVVGGLLLYYCWQPWPDPKAYAGRIRGGWHQDGRRR